MIAESVYYPYIKFALRRYAQCLIEVMKKIHVLQNSEVIYRNKKHTGSVGNMSFER